MNFFGGNRNRVVHLLRQQKGQKIAKICEANIRSEASVPAISTRKKKSFTQVSNTNKWSLSATPANVFTHYVNDLKQS